MTSPVSQTRWDWVVARRSQLFLAVLRAFDAYDIAKLEPIEDHPLAHGTILAAYQPTQTDLSLSELRLLYGPLSSSKGKEKVKMTATTPARSGASPSNSPRLPSPPPIAEIQFGPQSPSLGAVGPEMQLDAPSKPDEAAARRIRPGTRAADMSTGPPLVSLHQLQEHLKALYSELTHNEKATHLVPITRETALQIARPPPISEYETVDKNLWLYELCRFLVLKANLVSVSLMADSPPCSDKTCPEMRASEWQYLCAVHEPPKSCCAIDYCNHTLDWAANVLTSPKHFPSRLQLGGEGGNAYQSMRQLTNIFRRVYRIFAHAWFQHRSIFYNVEAIYGIYIFFKTVCDEYQLIPEDNYTIPPEAEGPRDEQQTSSDAVANNEAAPQMQILRKENQQPPNESGHKSAEAQVAVSTAQTARRHKHNPSTGSHVTTIAEGQEDEDEQPVVTPTSDARPQDPKTPSPERSLIHNLGRLDISSTVPAYVPDQIEDPTPTAASAQNVDPLAAAGKIRRNSGFESEVRSPGGGSVRTGGPDVLHAILDHMADNEEDEELEKADMRSEPETTIAVEDAPKVEQAVEGDEEDEDDLETMERIDIPSPELKSSPFKAPAGVTDTDGTLAEKEASGKAEDEKDAVINKESVEVAAETEKTDAKVTSDLDEGNASTATTEEDDLSKEQSEAPAGVA